VTVYYWVNDNADGDFHNANNWSLTSGGAGGAGVPGAADRAYFRSTVVDDCTISSSITIEKIDWAGYSGTLDIGGNIVTLTQSVSSSLNITNAAAGTIKNGVIDNAGEVQIRVGNGQTFILESLRIKTTWIQILGMFVPDNRVVLKGTVIWDGVSSSFQVFGFRGDMILDCETHNASQEYRSCNFPEFVALYGTATYLRGTGTLTFTETTNVQWAADIEVENVVVDVNAGQLFTLTADLRCLSLEVAEGDTDLNGWDVDSEGDIVFSGTDNVAFGDGAISAEGDIVFSGSGDVDLDGATIETAGDFDTSAQHTGEWDRGESTIELSGNSGDLILGGNAYRFRNVNVNGDYLHFGTNYIFYGTMVIAADCTFTISDGGGEYVIQYGNLTVNGTLSGNRLYMYNESGETLSFGPSGRITLQAVYWRPEYGGIIQAHTYEVIAFYVYVKSGGDVTATWGAGDFIFTGTFVWDCSEVCTVNLAANNPNIEFRGTVAEQFDNNGALLWNNGTGTITFNPDGVVSTIEFDGKTIDAVEVIGDLGGRLVLSEALLCLSFTGTDGDLDLAGETITVTDGAAFDHTSGFRFWNGSDASMADGVIDCDGGAVTFTGSQGDALELTDLDVDLAAGTTAAATWCDLTNSVVTYVDSQGDATGRCNDGGGNTGWDFEGGAPIHCARTDDERAHWRADDERAHWRTDDERAHWRAE
jgi:hypothetical protein